MKPFILQGHSRPIRDIKFNREGDLLFTGSSDRFVTLWGSETGERIGTYYHSAAVISMCVTLDSKMLVSGDATGGLYFWEVSTGTLLRKIEMESTVGVKYVDLSLGDQKVCMAYGGRTKEAKSSIDVYSLTDIFAARTEITKEGPIIKDCPILKTFESTKSKFNNCKWINMNGNILCGREDGVIQLFDYESGSVLKEKQFHKEIIMDLDISKREEVILTASKDGKSLVIDPDTFEVLHTMFPQNPTRNLNSCKISPLFSIGDPEEEKFHAILAGGQESRDVTTTHAKKGGFEILFYNLMFGEELGAVQGHFGPVNTLAFGPSGKVVASGGEDATIRVHKLDDDYLNLDTNK
jgi:translation initiation factor 3 subunit I